MFGCCCLCLVVGDVADVAFVAVNALNGHNHSQRPPHQYKIHVHTHTRRVRALCAHPALLRNLSPIVACFICLASGGKIAPMDSGVKSPIIDRHALVLV